jgi:hypothetical protein
MLEEIKHSRIIKKKNMRKREKMLDETMRIIEEESNVKKLIKRPLMKIRAKGDSHSHEPISENLTKKYLLVFLKIEVCIACIYLAIPPPGMKTVSPSSPVLRPEEDTRDVFNKFEISNNLKKLFEK